MNEKEDLKMKEMEKMIPADEMQMEAIPVKRPVVNNVLYVGPVEHGYFIEEYAQKNTSVCYDYEPPCAHIEEQVNKILDHPAPDYTVYDVDQYIDEPDVIVSAISRTCRANNSKAIIMALGFSAWSDLVLALRDAGIRYFIMSTDERGMIDEFLKCMNGYFDANELLEIRRAAEEKKEEEKKEVKTRLIGIAGCCKRIGTTTHAVQIVKYLMSKGYKAAYIQMNSTDYIKAMRSWLILEESDEDREIGLVRYGNVDHFYKMEKIPDVLKLGYDFCVYDYGTYLDPNFNRVSFLEKDFRIFVVGSDPAEMDATYRVVERSYFDEVKYIFNFVSMNEEEDIYELMEEKRDNTFLCTQHIADKYVLCSTEIYDKIINVEVKKGTEDSLKKRRGLFGRGFNKNAAD